jgi:hypothetical protein
MVVGLVMLAAAITKLDRLDGHHAFPEGTALVAASSLFYGRLVVTAACTNDLCCLPRNDLQDAFRLRLW